jgi:tetratricopeptide (TPR) repeat protein
MSAGSSSVKESMDRGVALCQQHNWAGAIAEFTKTIEMDPTNALAYCNRGAAYAGMLDWKGSVADLNRAIELDANVSKYWRYRGDARAELPDLDGAIADLSKAVELNPADFVAFGNRGIARARKGQNDEALADFSRAIELNPEYVPAFRGRASVYHRQKKSQEAKANLELGNLIDGARTNSSALYVRAWAYERCGLLEPAIRDVSALIETNSRSTHLYAARAWFEFEDGQTNSAASDSNKAVSFGGKSAGVHLARGVLHYLGNDFPRACEDWKQASMRDVSYEESLAPWIEKVCSHGRQQR